MLSLEDCIALSELTEEEVRAIAEHENLTEIVASEMGHYLMRTPAGKLRIKAMIRDHIVAAQAAGDLARAAALKLVLRSYVCGHPACDERRSSEARVPERRAL